MPLGERIKMFHPFFLTYLTRSHFCFLSYVSSSLPSPRHHFPAFLFFFGSVFEKSARGVISISFDWNFSVEIAGMWESLV